MLKSLKRLSLFIFGEVAGILLLIGFVVALATMPPLMLKSQPNSFLSRTVSVDTGRWKENVTKYYETLKQGSLGKDYKGREVSEQLSARMSNSLKLAGISIGLATLIGVVKGFVDFNAVRRKGLAIGPVLTGAVQGLPDFWLILMLQLGAAWIYRTFGYSPFNVAWSSEEPVASLVYPVISLTLIPAAYVARITAVAMANVYDKEYIRTARAKGLHEFLVIFRHALRNAIVQILDGLPSVAAVMVSNLLIVEYLFNYPGLTTLLKDAVNPPIIRVPGQGMMAPGADVPVLVAAGVSLGLIFSALFLLVNILRRVADPRLKERDQA